MNNIAKVGGAGIPGSVPHSYARRFKKIARILRLKHYYQERRAGTFAQRWAMIEQRLGPSDRSLLDIGCNIGQFTAKAAERGMFALGVEAQEEILAQARRLHAHEAHIAFGLLDITPASVASLPAADVTLALSVHHYWTRAFGDAASWQIIATLLQKSGKLFLNRQVPTTATAPTGRISSSTTPARSTPM